MSVTSVLAIKGTEKCDSVKSRAEWVALLKAVKVMFVIQLLQRMKILVELLDNVGPISMAGNFIAMNYTKYVDKSYNYVNEYVVDDMIKIVFVKSTENDSKLVTKNLGRELNGKHSQKMISEEQE